MNWLLHTSAISPQRFLISKYTEEAEYMTAFCQYKLSPSFRLDQEPSLKAINAFQDFANKYPESERVPECNEHIDELRAKLEEKAYEEGMLYYNLSQFEACCLCIQKHADAIPGITPGRICQVFDFQSFVSIRAEKYL
jgi:outer membrane protein assembly factor BamD